MHQKFLKLISFMLVVSLLLSVVTTSNFPSLIVSAEESISEDNRTEEESKEDAVLLTSITGDWNRAKRDGIVPPYGQFHHDVQDHIIDKYKKIILQMNIQLPLNLDKLQLETKQELEELIYILRMLKTILLIFGK